MPVLIFAVLSTIGAADDAFAPRLETLRFHVERLEAIAVPADLEAEKQARLAELKAKLDAGVADEEAFKSLYYAVDAVRMWLWENAAEKPAVAEGAFEETDAAWTVTTPRLTLLWSRADGVLTMRTPTAEWQTVPCDNNDIQYGGKSFGLLSAGAASMAPFNTGYSVGMTGTFAQFPDAPELTLRLTANVIGDDIVFELAAEESTRSLGGINWPKAIASSNTAADVAVIPRMQGLLLPGDWPQEIHSQEPANSRTIYMPWWGHLREGHGLTVILETSDDGGVTYHHSSGGPTRVTPRWYSSLGQLRYLRTIRYCFSDGATYVTLAKRYRRYVQEHGDFVSLEEKRVASPALNEVIGRPVIHLGALYHFVQEASLFNKDRIEANHALRTFDQLAEDLRTIKGKGIDDAYVHLDGWGFYGYDNGHPDVLPVGQEQGGWEGLRAFSRTCAELGYLFAVHDQYRDFYLNAVSFDDRLVATRLDGSREEHSTWCGGPQTILSPRFAPEYVRRNHDLFAANGVDVRGAYLDVFAVVPLEESAQPTQPVTRSDCNQYRRDCFELLRARGYVVSSEEPADYLVRTLHLVHHGPYATYPNIGGGDASGIPVPLFNLVYHDAILLPWEMGDAGGWGVPKSDAAWLHCLLNAGLPYVYPGATEEQIALVKTAAALAQRCGTAEMVNHELLDGTNRKQRTTFSDGTQVTVDFDAKTFSIEPAL